MEIMKKLLLVFSVLLVLAVMAACAGGTPAAPPTLDVDLTNADQQAPPVEQNGQNAEEVISTPNLDAIRDRGYLIVGVFGETPPFGYVTADGEHAGRDIYIARRFAYELFGDADAVQFVITEAANRIEFLRSYRVDVIIANFTVTEERAEQVDFALPYSRVALGIVAPEGNDIQSVADLNGRDLIVTQGTTAEIYFTQNHPEINLVRFQQNTESFAALQDGRGDAMAHDNTLLFVWAYENEGFRIVEGNLGNPDVLAPAVRQNSEDLLEWLNETTLRLRDEEFFYHVFEMTMRDYFHPDTQPSDVMYN